MYRLSLNGWILLQNIGGQVSDLTEKMRLELGACKSWKISETILTGDAKKNSQETNRVAVDSAFPGQKNW